MQTPRREPCITKDMTVLDVVSEHRSTETVFRRYDDMAGVCICCACLFETIEDLARAHGLDLETLLRELEAAALPGAAGEPS